MTEGRLRTELRTKRLTLQTFEHMLRNTPDDDDEWKALHRRWTNCKNTCLARIAELENQLKLLERIDEPS